MTETKMQLVDWLDDLCVRFIVNLPKEELESVERICFQVEEAQWFYEDFIRPLDPNLPSLNLRQFCLRIFQHCPLLSGFSPYHHSTAFSEFLAYKTRVPVRGAIMLNEAMDEVILVKGWKKNANWSFPRGKINKDEKDLDCAVREVYEETGFDIQVAGLVPHEQDVKYIEVTMREQHMRLYVFRGVPMETYFEPRTRKEISKIQWYKLSELPTLKKMRQQQQDGQGSDLAINANKFYMVAPFLTPLKKWISVQRKLDAMDGNSGKKVSSAPEDFRHQEKDNTITDITIQPPPADDMHRLMTQLRQSGQVALSTNPIELSAPTETISDASMQLESLLHVPPVTTGRSQTNDKPLASRDDKASAMLSLLRSGLSDDPEPASESLRVLQTPFEQNVRPLKTQASPKHQFVRASQAPSFPYRTAFPFSSNHIGISGIPQQSFSSAQQLLMHVSAPYLASQEGGKTPIYPYPAPTSKTQQQRHHVLAPYQRTGDPQFAHSAQESQRMPSSIPPANALPQPKLNSHSSALLDLFKSSSLSKSSSPALPAQNLFTSLDPKVRSDQPITPMQLKEAKRFAPQLTYESRSLTGQTTSVPAYSTPPIRSTEPRSQQQEALLNIFRTPSTLDISKVHTSGPSLAPPTTLVELSAQQSPNHPRVISDVVKDAPKPWPSNGHIKIQKRPESVREASQGPFSATVTGPLNFPQFDKIAKRHEELTTKAPNTSIETTSSIVHRSQTQPMTILSRLVADVDPTQISATSTLSSTSFTRDRLRPVSPYHKKLTEKKHSPKAFHPQILRRPAEIQPPHHVSPLLHPVLSPISTSNDATAEIPSPLQPRPLITKDNLFLDRRGSQTLEQENTLLSLFSKPTAMLPPPTPTRISAISPMSEKALKVDSFVPLPLDTSKTRIASWNSDAGEGNGTVVIDGMSSRMTPKPSPVDKKFLLGFLDEVVRKGSK